jgi:hypothetical protein
MAAKSDAEHHLSESAREAAEVRDKADIEAAEVTVVFQSYGLTAEKGKPVVVALRKRPQAWVDFMMRFEPGLLKNPIPSAWSSVQERLQGLTLRVVSFHAVHTLFSPQPRWRLPYR